MHNRALFLFFLSFILSIPLTYAAPTPKSPTTEIKQSRVTIPVKISVSNAYYVTTISICNTTNASIPLTDIELDFNYSTTMPTNIWGNPWAAWHVNSQSGNSVVLLGGTPYTPALAPDPNCTNPLTVMFNAAPSVALPTGPFVFKAAGGSPPTQTGKLTVTMQAAPTSGLSTPKVTVAGMGSTASQTVNWGTSWQLTGLSPGPYSVTANNVNNGTQYYQANAVNADVEANATAAAAITYTEVANATGNLKITLPAAPASGLSKPEVTIAGGGLSSTQTLNWGSSWQLSKLTPGVYNITAGNVSNGTATYQAAPITATVAANATATAAIKYVLVNSSTGNLNVTLPTAPSTGLSNPSVTVTGNGKSYQKTVAWGANWALTQLASGQYTVTGSNVTNSTSTYQAAPLSVTVVADATAQATLVYTQASSNRPVSWNNIQHVVVIIFENVNASTTLKQPYFKSLTQTGAYLAQSYGVTHPSQPNYIALVAGSTLGVTSDSTTTVNGKNISDLIEAQGKTWKAYAEDLPSTTCFLGTSSGNYVRKHEPFISFKSIQSDPTKCANIVSSTQFFTDVAANNLPTFSLYIPNLLNDAHNTDVAYANKWLSSTFGNILSNSSILKNTLFIITFDEDDFTNVNQIYTAFVGAAVNPGSQSSVHYNHYNVLRTIEEIFNLGTLGTNDTSAAVITGIWQP